MPGRRRPPSACVIQTGILEAGYVTDFDPQSTLYKESPDDPEHVCDELSRGGSGSWICRRQRPVKEKLIAAKAAYEVELKKYRKDASEWFDKREEVARKDGNKKQVDLIKAERATFEESGELPKTIPAAIRQKPGFAKKTLEAAYAQAVKEYTMIKKDTEAAAVEAEGEAFMKEPIGSPVPGRRRRHPPGAVVPAKLGAYAGRTGAAKAKLIQDGGGNEASERAVSLGLAWLAKQQKKDGSWEYDIGQKEHNAAATAMALLPFLAAGETHTDAKAQYKDVVKKGLDWLVKNCPAAGPNAGRINTNMYVQAPRHHPAMRSIWNDERPHTQTGRTSRDQFHPEGSGTERQLGVHRRH